MYPFFLKNRSDSKVLWSDENNKQIYGVRFIDLLEANLSYDVASGSEIRPFIIFDKPLVLRDNVHNNVAYIMTKLSF